MTMPSTGALNMGGTVTPVSVAQELGLGLTTTISMDQANVRTLAGVSSTSGTSWSMNSLYGKSNRRTVTYVISADTVNGIVTIGSTSPTTGTYIAGLSDVTVRINSAVYAYSNAVGTAGFRVAGGSVGDTLVIENNGYILGMGGGGGSANDGSLSSGANGGNALSITATVTGTITLNNNSGAYIAGGGGGGGGISGSSTSPTVGGGGGGGGAGGGAGGAAAATFTTGFTTTTGGAGGTVGNAGSTGGFVGDPNGNASRSIYGGGGGGRRPTNATGGATAALRSTGGVGGGAGGGGSSGDYNVPITIIFAGGGGGFGAAGERGVRFTALAAPPPATGGVNFNPATAPTGSFTVVTNGGTGGYSITKGGNSVSVGGTGTIWGTQLA